MRPRISRCIRRCYTRATGYEIGLEKTNELRRLGIDSIIKKISKKGGERIVYTLCEVYTSRIDTNWIDDASTSISFRPG